MNRVDGKVAIVTEAGQGIVSLASEDASFVTGSAFADDGGFWLK